GPGDRTWWLDEPCLRQLLAVRGHRELTRADPAMGVPRRMDSPDRRRLPRAQTRWPPPDRGIACVTDRSHPARRTARLPGPRRSTRGGPDQILRPLSGPDITRRTHRSCFLRLPHLASPSKIESAQLSP